jgi:hypothetical protein
MAKKRAVRQASQPASAEQAVCRFGGKLYASLGYVVGICIAMKPLSLGSRIGSPANARFTQCVLDAINVEKCRGSH